MSLLLHEHHRKETNLCFQEKKKAEPFLQHRQSPFGLLCALCNRFACRLCLLSLNKTFTKKMLLSDQWCRDVRTYLLTAQESSLEKIDVGHCCYLNDDSLLEKKDKAKSSYLEGHLLLYEYGVIIDPPLGGSCDVHGFGNDPVHHLKGVHHAVVDGEFTCQIPQTDKVILDGSRTSIEGYQPPTYITIPGLSTNSKSKKIEVEWFVLRPTGSFPPERLADKIREKDLSGCGTGFFNNKQAPLQLLIGATEAGDTYHLLNARWYNVQSIATTSRADQHKLFEDCKLSLKRGGFEANRKNSGGRTTVNAQLRKFLNHPGNLPRKAVGVKIFQREKDWQFLYISTTNSNVADHPNGDTRKVASWKYTQPQIGGSFNLPVFLFEKYNFLYDFVRCKVETALVLQALKANFGLNVQPGAVATQMAQLEAARVLYDGNDMAILRHVSRLNMYTLVAYPVAYHTDTFADGEASLENKVCFVNPPMNSKGIGRGGAGADEFVYALLDWTKKNKRKRRTRSTT